MSENPTALNLQAFFAIPSIQPTRAFPGHFKRLSTVIRIEDLEKMRR